MATAIVSRSMALVALRIIIAALAAAATSNAAAAASLPSSLAKACDDLSKDTTAVVFHACRGLGRSPTTLLEACDEVTGRLPASAVGDVLGDALTAIADGRALTVPIRDIYAACALGSVPKALVAACADEAPGALAAACNASRDVLLGNGGAGSDDVPSAPAPPPPPKDAAATPTAPIIIRDGIKATPVACLLGALDHEIGSRVISHFLHGALRGRSCALVENIALASITDCFTLDEACGELSKASRIMPSAELELEAAEAIAGGPLEAAFVLLETGGLSGTTPETLATACALVRSPSILREACTSREPPGPCDRDDVIDEGRCRLNLFIQKIKGERA